MQVAGDRRRTTLTFWLPSAPRGLLRHALARSGGGDPAVRRHRVPDWHAAWLLDRALPGGRLRARRATATAAATTDAVEVLGAGISRRGAGIAKLTRQRHVSADLAALAAASL